MFTIKLAGVKGYLKEEFHKIRVRLYNFQSLAGFSSLLLLHTSQSIFVKDLLETAFQINR